MKKMCYTLITFLIFLITLQIFGQNEDCRPIWKKNFGENQRNLLSSAVAISDYIVSVGSSGYSGDEYAYIAKYDNIGNIIWEMVFSYDYYIMYNCFYSVTAVSDGIIAVGYSGTYNFGTCTTDYYALIVKYDDSGNVVWKEILYNVGVTKYHSVTAVSDGIIAVGYASSNSFGTGDLVGVSGKGEDDAIIVKYNNAGNVVWKKSFGGSKDDHFTSVVAVSDGIIAMGYSQLGSFGNGDWASVSGKGGNDAIIVKYDNAGNVVWKKNFGGSGNDCYDNVTLVSDGIVAVGNSQSGSFGTGDWIDVTGNGNDDAIIVKYDNTGNVVWKKNFGGNMCDYFLGVTTTSDGIVAAGYSDGGFGSGNWTDVTGKGKEDAVIVKYDNNGNVVWKKNFGGKEYDSFCGVTTVFDGVVAVGTSEKGSFGNGDWNEVTSFGEYNDAIIVKYVPFFSVTDIMNVPTKAVVGTPLPLTAKILPENATFQNIDWSISSPGTTSAVIIDNTLYATAEGTALIMATIKDGTAIGTDYTKLFFITVSTVGITENSQNTALHIYPNPTTGELIIDDEQLNKGINPLVVEIFDVYGKKISAHQLITSSSHYLINISHLPAGVYFLRVDEKIVKVIKN